MMFRWVGWPFLSTEWKASMLSSTAGARNNSQKDLNILRMLVGEEGIFSDVQKWKRMLWFFWKYVWTNPFQLQISATSILGALVQGKILNLDAATQVVKSSQYKNLISNELYFFLEWEGVLQLQTRKTQPHHCPQSPRHQCWCEWAKCDSICKNLSVVEIEITSLVKFFHIATNETLQLTNQLLSLNHLTLKYLAMFLFRWPSPTFGRWVVFLPTGCPKNVLQDQNLEPVSSWDSINTHSES